MKNKPEIFISYEPSEDFDSEFADFVQMILDWERENKEDQKKEV